MYDTLRQRNSVKQKGASLVFFSFMATFVVGGAILAAFMFNMYTDTLEIETSGKSQSQFVEFSLREEILNAECATKHRGVFYMDAIDDGSGLDCIAFDEPILVSFGWWELESEAGAIDRAQNFESVGYRIAPGSPSDVSQELLDLTIDDFIDNALTPRNHPIVIIEEDAGTQYQGVLSFTE